MNPNPNHPRFRRCVTLIRLALFASGIAASCALTVAGPPPVTPRKLDAQLVLALQQARGEPPFDKPTSLQPDIPIRDGTRVLVDLEATVSEDLLKHLALIGGKVARSPDASRIVRVMLPLTQVEALEGRADIKAISPATLSMASGTKAEPHPTTATSKAKP